MSSPFSSLAKTKHLPFPLYGDSKHWAKERELTLRQVYASTRRDFRVSTALREEAGLLDKHQHEDAKVSELSDMSLASQKAYFALHPEQLHALVLKHLSKEDLINLINAKRKGEDHSDSGEHPVKSRVLLKRFSKSAMIKDMAQQLIDDIRECSSCYFDLLYDFVGIIGTAIKCDRFAMYVMQASGKELHIYVPAKQDGRSRLGMAGYVGEGTTVAAYVASIKEAILISDVHHDDRFCRGVGSESAFTGSVICLPVITPQDDVFCVMEFTRGYNRTSFMREELHTAMTFATLLGIVLYQCEVADMLTKQQELNNFLLDFSKIAFAELTSFEQLVRIIMAKTKCLVHADRCAMFLVDNRTNELYSFLLDNGEEDQDGAPVFVRKEIRFSIERGIAGAVAQTCQIINIADAYKDDRFNRDIDMQTGYTTRSILCMPIVMEGKAIGVVEMINKTREPGFFTKLDEDAFKMLAVYSAIALHFSRLYSCVELETAQRKVALEQVSYHYRVSDAEVTAMAESPLLPKEQIPVMLNEYIFYGPETHEDQLHKLFITMVHRLLGSSCFDCTTLCRFVLTVRKNYRPVAYHNWLHGWNVSHCIYCMLMRLKESTDLFSTLHMKALLVASLCHDVDHRGYSNAFFKKLNEPLAILYNSSVMERHHYAVTVKILQEEGHNIFQDFDATDYKQVLEYMRHAIISTDLVLYTPNQQKLAALVSSNQLNLLNPDHFMYSVSLMMTAADLSAVCKGWDMQRHSVTLIYDEFYRQGDIEKQLGLVPLKMMDRSNIHDVPTDQIAFIKFVCVPCYRTLADIYVDTKPLLDLCLNNMAKWESVVESKNWDPTKVIDPQEDFLVDKKKPSYLYYKKSNSP